MAVPEAWLVSSEQLSLARGLFRTPGWNLHVISARIAVAIDRRMDRSRGGAVHAARSEAMDSDRFRHGLVVRSSVAAMDSAQRDHAARISAPRAEIFQFARRADPLRLHELGEDVAVSISRRLPRAVETE